MTPAVNQAIKASGLPWEGKDPGARKDLLSASCFIHRLSAASVPNGGVWQRKNAKEKWEGLPKIYLSLGIPSLAKEKDSWFGEDRASQLVLLVKLRAEQILKNILKLN